MKTKILGVPIDTYSNEEVHVKLKSFLNQEKNHILITPNPEIVLKATEDEEFKKIIEEAELVIPDGIGVVIASKFNKEKIKERVTGFDTVQWIFGEIKNTPHSVYLLGAKPGVAKKAKAEMEKKYPGIKIIGARDGYFDSEKEKIIIEEIKNLKPDILVLGLGFPRQEKWAHKYKNILPVKISCCVGGSIDAMAGEVKRAPEIYQKLNLEWLYRLLKQPSRITRMYKLPLFLVYVMKDKILGR